MKVDIVGYEERFAKKMGQVLAALGIPTFGPATGIELLRMVEGVDEMLKKNKDKLTPEMVTLFQGYRTRILDICAVSIHHQGAVMEKLESLLKGT